MLGYVYVVVCTTIYFSPLANIEVCLYSSDGVGNANRVGSAEWIMGQCCRSLPKMSWVTLRSSLLDNNDMNHHHKLFRGIFLLIGIGKILKCTSYILLKCAFLSTSISIWKWQWHLMKFTSMIISRKMVLLLRKKPSKVGNDEVFFWSFCRRR